jgi:hypothetical protein
MNDNNTGKTINTETFQDIVEAIKSVKKKKKKVASTSVAAFEDTAPQRVTGCKRIVIFVEHNPGSSREEVMKGTGIKLQTVTGNVTYLIKNRLIEQREVKLNDAGRKVGRLWPAV